jgi:hypothetical protein
MNRLITKPPKAEHKALDRHVERVFKPDRKNPR